MVSNNYEQTNRKILIDLVCDFIQECNKWAVNICGLIIHVCISLALSDLLPL